MGQLRRKSNIRDKTLRPKPRGKSPRGKSPRGKSPRGKSPRGKSPYKLKLKSHFTKISRLPCEGEELLNCPSGVYEVRREDKCMGCEDVLSADIIENNPVCVNNKCYELNSLKRSIRSTAGRTDPFSRQPLLDPDELLVDANEEQHSNEEQIIIQIIAAAGTVTTLALTTALAIIKFR